MVQSTPSCRLKVRPFFSHGFRSVPPENLARDRILRIEAIILRRLDLGETDRILTVLSDKFGKMKIIAKGVRRPNSRLASHLELFARSNLVLARGRDLDVVTSADILDLHLGLRIDLSALAIASHTAELIDRFLTDREENLKSFRVLSRTLAALDTGKSPQRVARWFEMVLLGEMGVRPELFHCVICSRAIEAEPNAFSIRHGGVLCKEHAAMDSAAMVLSVAAQKVLRMLIRADLDAYLALSNSPQLDLELEAVLSTFIKAQLERDLNSLRVMRRVEESLPTWEPYKSTK